uniref:NADH-ubiquinone oxidoreductase chain 3 n=2 Tax=unclassified Hiatella TaxID=2619785 RepID=A0AA51UHW8_9BIVA|nr:NADH dehydrogenase subunit 3 [Hiatella sp. J HML-2015]WMW23658.1 NADH dehydrogenase subunit 3 [Hiatella sp. J YW-2023]
MQDFYSGLVYGVMVILVAIILVWINYALGSRYSHSRSGMGSFECGFDAMHNARSPFSLRFFLLAILFLAFDMEVALLLFYVWGKTEVSGLGVCKCGVFVGILLGGLIHELNEGTLSWLD